MQGGVTTQTFQENTHKLANNLEDSNLSNSIICQAIISQRIKKIHQKML